MQERCTIVLRDNDADRDVWDPTKRISTILFLDLLTELDKLGHPHPLLHQVVLLSGGHDLDSLAGISTLTQDAYNLMVKNGTSTEI